jgi:chromosome partitioning protein
MPALTPNDLQILAAACTNPALPPRANRPLSIWEITSWILPMAPEHFRRVLAATPSLPQGHAGAEGGTRWFTPADLAPLRTHFATGPRKARYAPARPLRAPLVTLTGPTGAMGRSTALLHIATACALSGHRILVIDGDPAGSLGQGLGSTLPGHGDGAEGTVGAGVLSLIARSAARHLRRLNEGRLDRGEAPQPMDAVLNAALTLGADDLIRPSAWPGLDVMAAPPALMQADLQIAGWRAALRSWPPGQALAAALDEESLRQRYDLILCDTPRGLGPLAMALLTSADTLLAPLPLREAGLTRLGAGLQALATATARADAEAQQTAQALGQTAPSQSWQRLAILPTRAGPDAAHLMAGFAAKLGGTLLPNPFPEIDAVASGQIPQFYDLDYRQTGRLAYAPLREACDAAARAVVQAVQ